MEKRIDKTDEWLHYEVENGRVTKMKCTLCTKHESRLKWERNFSKAFIARVKAVKKDNLNKHYLSTMHATAQQLEKKSVPLIELMDEKYQHGKV